MPPNPDPLKLTSKNAKCDDFIAFPPLIKQLNEKKKNLLYVNKIIMKLYIRDYSQKESKSTLSTLIAVA